MVDHPLVQHKLHILRDEQTGTNQFRQLVTELAIFEGYEAMRDFPLEDVEVKTPLETASCKRLAGKKVAVVPILRAGLGMVDGILQLVPSARVGHVGMFRDPETHEPHPYYCKLPSDVGERTCLVVDPMLATGGSLVAALKYLREAGAKDIRCLTLVSAPEGVTTVLETDPDVRLYTCSLDRCLDQNAYIRPGLGDAATASSERSRAARSARFSLPQPPQVSAEGAFWNRLENRGLTASRIVTKRSHGEGSC